MAAGARFPSYFISDDVPVWDEAERGVLAARGGRHGARSRSRLTLDELRRCRAPSCASSTSASRDGRRSRSVPACGCRELARRVGVPPDARYVDFQSFDDDYHESWDIESALHPQTLIVYGQDGRLLGPAYGAPARVYSPVKLGYKNTKYLTRVGFLASGTAATGATRATRYAGV